MNKMNNKKEKTMFSVENLDDGSRLSIKSYGHPVAVGFMIAIALVRYIALVRSFDQEDTVLSMDEFIPVLKKAYNDSEFLDRMVQALNLYANNEKDGLKAFAMLMAVASVKSTSEGKEKEKHEQ